MGPIVPNISKIAFPPKCRWNSMRGGPEGKGARGCPPLAAPLRTLLSGPKPLKAGPGRARSASRASILIGGSGRSGQREKPGGGGGRCEGSGRERSGVWERSRAGAAAAAAASLPSAGPAAPPEAEVAPEASRARAVLPGSAAAARRKRRKRK